MPEFFALVDAVPGREAEVERALRAQPRLAAVVAVKERSNDFLVRFEAPAFSQVDDLLQTHVRPLPGVKGVEIVTDWAALGPAAVAARDALRRGSARRAVVLLSGGLDSTVAAAMAKAGGHELHAVSFDYGQRHARELASAKAVAERLGVATHAVLRVPVGGGASALTDGAIEVPTGRDERAMAADIPATYVPARNIVFLSLALGIAEAKDADAIYIGANALDYSGYPDCRPEFFEAFEEMARRGTKRGVEGRPVRIEVPLLRMTKADIVREGVRLQAPLELTWSCYVGGAKACGACDSCLLRLKGFREAGVADPALYA